MLLCICLHQKHPDSRDICSNRLPNVDLYEALFKESTTTSAYAIGANEIDPNHSPERRPPDPDRRSNDSYHSDNEEVLCQLREDLNMDHGGTCTNCDISDQRLCPQTNTSLSSVLCPHSHAP